MEKNAREPVDHKATVAPCLGRHFARTGASV
jgi:hypothetical protein